MPKHECTYSQEIANDLVGYLGLPRDQVERALGLDTRLRRHKHEAPMNEMAAQSLSERIRKATDLDDLMELYDEAPNGSSLESEAIRKMADIRKQQLKL